MEQRFMVEVILSRPPKEGLRETLKRMLSPAAVKQQRANEFRARMEESGLAPQKSLEARLHSRGGNGQAALKEATLTHATKTNAALFTAQAKKSQAVVRPHVKKQEDNFSKHVTATSAILSAAGLGRNADDRANVVPFARKTGGNEGAQDNRNDRLRVEELNRKTGGIAPVTSDTIQNKVPEQAEAALEKTFDETMLRNTGRETAANDTVAAEATSISLDETKQEVAANTNPAIANKTQSIEELEKAVVESGGQDEDALVKLCEALQEKIFNKESASVTAQDIEKFQQATTLLDRVRDDSNQRAAG